MVICFLMLILVKGSITVENMVFDIDESFQATLIEVNDSVSILTIPSIINYGGNEYSVVKIGNNVFYGCNFYGELKLPDNLQYIGEYAFSYCAGFTGDLYIPTTVIEIGSYSFIGCSGFNGNLTIDGPCNLIGYYAFSKCNGFKGSLNLNNGISRIRSNAFEYCDGFSGDLVIPENIQTLESDAFRNCTSLEKAIYHGTTIINDGYVFRYCIFKCIYVADEYQGDFFGGLKVLNSNSITHNNLVYKMNDNNDELSLIGCIQNIACQIVISSSVEVTVQNQQLTLNVTSIHNSAFLQCDMLFGHLSIPDSITIIPSYAFSECSGFTSLELPNTLTNIGEYSFSKCYGFHGNLILPNSITDLGSYAFSECSGFLYDIAIPDSLETIKQGLFYKCSGFNGSIIFPSTIISIKSYSFYECCSLSGSLEFPSSIEEIATYSFYGCTNMTGSLIIPETIKTITAFSFPQLSNMKGNITLSNGITSIGNYAFYESGFTGDLIFPETVTSIGSYSFSLCNGFNGTLKIPSSISTIGSSAFNYCNGLIRAIYEGQNFTTNNEIFEQTKFRSIGVPSNYEFNLFSKIPAVKPDDLRIDNLIYRIIDSDLHLVTLYGCEVQKEEQLNIPSSITYDNIEYTISAINQNAFYSCHLFQDQLIIPNTISEIGNYAFYTCTGFSGRLVIPDTIKTINSYSFGLCSGITSVVLPSSIEVITDFAFFNCQCLRICLYKGINEPSISLSSFISTLISEVGVSSNYNGNSFAGYPIYYYDAIPTDVFTYGSVFYSSNHGIILSASFFVYLLPI
ncbi:hypothetical protein TRFO_34747 [Tritrichomonas foetus]|uniref:Surface antigen BspA-like n=1 Tax=Tritrichomonas foetus TaxID=1144522 RepID=A0A1J4JJX8_9EUKA|nr:hypothetical protein TRFO_34747 [Tritrichomonas foetus]|eukprot:OHS98913.1 hypothetical protein TRFO_34747 [Tritrichomonas foetus]